MLLHRRPPELPRRMWTPLKSQTAHLVLTAVLWAVLTAIGEVLAFADLYPTVGSEEARESDDIFRFLLILGMPVFTFVLAVLFYSFLRFRTTDVNATGPLIRGEGWVPRVWLVATSGLAVFVIIYPGLWGVAELRENGSDYGFGKEIESEALEVHVTAFQWAWTIEYPELGISIPSATGEMVLPVHRQVVFEIDSSDVLHSYWIPAFRMKIDAIPGRTTRLVMTPDQLGNFEDDAAYRIQCAELCGLGHTDMSMAVRVVEEDEFEAWVSEQGGE